MLQKSLGWQWMPEFQSIDFQQPLGAEQVRTRSAKEDVMSVRFNSPNGGNARPQGETRRRSPDEARDGGRTRGNEPGRTNGNGRANGNQKPGGSVTITLELTSDDIGFGDEKPRQKGAGNGGGGGGGKQEAVGQETGTNPLMDFLKKLFGGKEAQQAPQEQQAPAGQQQAPPQGTDSILQKIMTMLTDLLQKLGKGEGSDGTSMQPEMQQIPQQQAPQQQAPVEQPPAAPPAPPTKGEKDLISVPTGNTGRPPGDNRSAEDIINDNPVLKNLGNEKDIKREDLKKQCGDWTDANPDPKSRADAAYNMSKVLNWIDSSKNRDGGDRGQGDGDLHLKGKEARHGTEAGNLKDFAEKGYGALKADHQLDQTKDSHVRLDGSSRSNFQNFLGKVGKAFQWFPLAHNMLEGAADSKNGSLGGMLKGAAKAYGHTVKEGLKGIWEGIKKGKLNPTEMFVNGYNAQRKTMADYDQVKTDTDKMLQKFRDLQIKTTDTFL
jgi:hypothetical protein